MTRGELSKRTGVHIETIRYYERIGILPEPPRTESGHRVYNDELAGRLTFIVRAKELGFALEETRALLSLMDEEAITCAEVKQITQMHIADVRQKISDLKKMEKVLKKMEAQCNGKNVPECPIIDALSGRIKFLKILSPS